MDYLKKEKVVEGLVIEEDLEFIKLIESAGYELTLVDEDFADLSKDQDINDDSEVWGKQRWLVEIQPKDKFLPPWKTHRYIKYYIETYREREKAFPRISEKERRAHLTAATYTTGEGMPKEGVDGIEWDDKFNNIY